jgi:murein DD-endopeptidase MepM/ murein hydrolase activator NlpD
MQTSAVFYTVQPNDTLGVIASIYGVTVEEIVEASEIADPNLLSVGQVLTIPAPRVAAPGPDFKLIPDSELVYGPYAEYFDLGAFIQEAGGQLAVHTEEVNGEILTGVQIIQRVAANHSVNPRLLLTLLEYQTGWVTQPQANLEALSYPIGYPDPYRSGLFMQLSWAANNLNRGYYLWRVNGIGAWRTADNLSVPASPLINSGTAGLHYLFGLLLNEPFWREAISPQGFILTYQQLFGQPWDWRYEPLLPTGLVQPTLQLPFEPGVPWTFTGGPHGGWDDGSAWAAIDFAPPMEYLGCNQNNHWVVAMADGLVVRADHGVVVQDLDGDGDPGTGWVLFYLHIESRDRVPLGTTLQAGERIGHPSCEGGYSTGTHVHIARRYNGEWIPADGPVPFVMDGWVSVGTGIYYNGYMQRGDQIIEACECQELEHTLQR